MPLIVRVTLPNPNVFAGQANTMEVSVENTSASSVTLESLAAFSSRRDVVIQQPNFLLPNRAAGQDSPTIDAAATRRFSFQFVAGSPIMPGPSPQNAPGGANPSTNAAPPTNSQIDITVMAQASDDEVGTGRLTFGVISAIEPIPAEGGALQLTQGANLVNLTMLGAL